MFTARRSTELRVLNFDTECRPMHYSEFRAESQMTGVAWSWIGSDKVHCRVLKQNLSNERAILVEFMDAFNEADMVTGHYLRKHDLPLLVDHCIRLEVPLPSSVLVQDTMLDMVSVKGLGKSQENLAHTFGLAAEKHHMCGASWRIANQLTREGRAGTKTRVVSDVIQNKQLRAELLERGLLKAPKRWCP